MEFDITARNIPIRMVREDLDAIPAFDPPEGYRVRWYRQGDEDTWVRIQKAADHYNTISHDLFRRQFGDDERELARRQFCLVEKGGEAVGTATAWFDEDYCGRPYGRIHWVAILPSRQGRGLSRPLMSIACRRLKELGHDCAYLTTSTARVAAVNLYLKFGFQPDIRSAEGEAAWRRLAPHLRQEVSL